MARAVLRPRGGRLHGGHRRAPGGALRLGGVGVFVVTFAAVWSTWTSFVVYADLAEETTRIAVMMAAAGLVGLMAASLGDLDERANAFAIAVVVCRIVAGRAALRTGRLLASWPGVQLGGITLPWIVSLWVEPPAKYWLWAAALALELLVAVRRASDDREAGRALAERLTAKRRRRARSDAVAPFVVVRARAEHLGERLGTFMIIVLGEAVAQLVRGASTAEWERGLAVTSLAAFAIVAGLWWLTFRQRSGEAQRPPFGLRTVLPVHLAMTGAVVAFAAALGELLQHPHAHPEGSGAGRPRAAWPCGSPSPPCWRPGSARDRGGSRAGRWPPPRPRSPRPPWRPRSRRSGSC